MSSFDPRSELRRLVDEHHDITRQIDDERRWYAEIRQLGKPSFGEMATRLNRLRAHLAAHFDSEERVEKDAASRGECKATSELMLGLQKVHGSLLKRLDSMISRCEGCGSSYDCWGDVGTEFETVISDLHAHETEELELLARVLKTYERPAS
jgi:hypothetical protein